MWNKVYILLECFLFCCSYTSCVKPYSPNLTRCKNNLVVDGAITDMPGPYTVKISLASLVTTRAKYIPVSNCEVEIIDNLGNSETLKETSAGEYQTDSLGMRGIVGRKYKVHIKTSWGDVIESVETMLRKGIGIQEIKAEYFSYVERSCKIEGYNFYVVPGKIMYGDSNYLYWAAERTYKFHSYFDSIFFSFDGMFHPSTILDSLDTCYHSEEVPKIFLYNPSEYNYESGVHFLISEDTKTERLTIRYCLTVRQYVLNREQYNYWNTLRKIIDHQGSLYDNIPYQVRGNLNNITNPKVPILGYFTVAGYSQKRIYVNRFSNSSYMLYDSVTKTVTCISNKNVKAKTLISRIAITSPVEWPLYITRNKDEVLNPYNTNVGEIVCTDIPCECVDCTKKGKKNPPWWWVK